jgi:hypothetical protein
MAPFRIGTYSGIVMLGTLTLASPSFAAEPQSATADAEFRKMDTNKDGKVSASEHAAGGEANVRNDG